ncbi:MAG: transposase [Candidatus Neptunochlamydia sp.]|nr:transposase [Candidatus Neptunochlamydia sp.]
MARFVINEDMWNRFKVFLPDNHKGGSPGYDERMFMEGVYWVIRTGAHWKDLPMEYGKQCINRYSRCVKSGKFREILEI